MRRAGMGESEILEALAAINRARCKPMLPQSEVQQIAHSVGHYRPAEKKSKKCVGPIEPHRQFPLESLPDPVRRFVIEMSTAIGCDPSFIALPMLGCLARAIGNKRVIRLKATWDEPAIVWVAIVGKSGTHKSPAIKATTAMLQRKQADAIERHQQEMADYTEKLAEYERAFAAMEAK